MKLHLNGKNVLLQSGDKLIVYPGDHTIVFTRGKDKLYRHGGGDDKCLINDHHEAIHLLRHFGVICTLESKTDRYCCYNIVVGSD